MTSDSRPKLPVVAVFDFDGTITYRDTLIPFMIFTRGWFRFIWAVISNLSVILLYLMGKVSRQTTKETFIAALFGGIPMMQMNEWGTQYAESQIEAKIRPKTLERLRWHQTQGHRCILVSANLDIYLVPWGKLMKFEKVICSRVASDPKGNVSGRLIGDNCWGPEKKNQIEKYLGPRNGYLLYSYGDSQGDKEMLAMADYPFWKNSFPTEGDSSAGKDAVLRPHK